MTVKTKCCCYHREGKRTPGELEDEGVIEGTYKGYRHGCYGCMPMRNQSHHHSERHYRENEKERQGDKDGKSELEMEPHTLLKRPMNAAQ